jgi:hypothetical protein
MPAILRQLPFHDRPTAVEVRGREYQILPDQIILWVSLGPKGVRDCDPVCRAFPWSSTPGSQTAS